MGAREQMYDFVRSLFHLVTNTGGVWYIAGPFIIMRLIISFIRWSYATARGSKSSMEDESIQSQIDDIRGEYKRLSSRSQKSRAYTGKTRNLNPSSRKRRRLD